MICNFQPICHMCRLIFLFLSMLYDSISTVYLKFLKASLTVTWPVLIQISLCLWASRFASSLVTIAPRLVFLEQQSNIFIKTGWRKVFFYLLPLILMFDDLRNFSAVSKLHMYTVQKLENCWEWWRCNLMSSSPYWGYPWWTNSSP